MATVVQPPVRDEGLPRFRASMRDWIAANHPSELPGVTDWNEPHIGGSTWGPTAAHKAHPAYVEWDRRLLDAGLICPQWPREYGGSGFSRLEMAIFVEECFRAGVPRVDRSHGETMVGPAILAHGSEQQRAHFLPRIIGGEDTYCQGFSEPGAGSDLASLQLEGRVDGDELVMTGQKTWTSRADEARLMYTLVRTARGERKHEGISFVLVPIDGPGAELRPIRQITGGTEFFETFLDAARAPMFNVIGGLGNGWHVAMTTLANERGGDRTMLRHLGLGRQLRDLVDEVAARDEPADQLTRQRLAWAHMQVELVRFAGLRYAAALAADREAGPEASITKLLWSEYHQRFGELALDLQGAEALVCTYGDGATSVTDRWNDAFLASRAGTIYSGTSEIQRRIVAERALGLPKG